ncbi:MAG: A/G-specific adenine glycosylase [Deltaproteobacteria bacterium]|nr:A/G-specific adenine glycosylase [Deltaproteobacteria bacterium]
MVWFGANARPLPWRGDYHPYRVWVAETMAQQTRMETLLPYYRRWMDRFPALEDVAAATQEEVLKLWEGLGYYSRARNLHKAARMMVESGGEVPDTWEGLLALPGVGPYTAGAVGSTAFNLPVPAVDGNVGRVVARLAALEEPPSGKEGKKQVAALAEGLVKAAGGRRGLSLGGPRALNQGLMELGSLICRPVHPECANCPLGLDCVAYTRGRQGDLPAAAHQPKAARVQGVMSLLGNQGRWLVRRRPAKGVWGGLWEFPWLVLEPGESVLSGYHRLLEEMGLDGGPAGFKPVGGAGYPPQNLGQVRHGLTHLHFTWDCLLGRLDETDPAVILAGEAVDGPYTARWATPDELARLPLGRPNHKALALLGQPLDVDHQGWSHHVSLMNVQAHKEPL